MSTRNRRLASSSSSSTAKKPSIAGNQSKKMGAAKTQFSKKRVALSDITNQRNGFPSGSRAMVTHSKPMVRYSSTTTFFFFNVFISLLISFYFLCEFLSWIIGSRVFSVKLLLVDDVFTRLWKGIYLLVLTFGSIKHFPLFNHKQKWGNMFLIL